MALVQPIGVRIKRKRKQEFKMTSGITNKTTRRNRTKSMSLTTAATNMIDLLKTQKQHQDQYNNVNDFCGLCIIEKQQQQQQQQQQSQYYNINNNYSQFYANQPNSKITKNLNEYHQPYHKDQKVLCETSTPTLIQTRQTKNAFQHPYICSLILSAITTRAHSYLISYTKFLLNSVKITKYIQTTNNYTNMCKSGQVKLVYDNTINECKKPYSYEGKTSTARSGKTGTRSIKTTTKTTTTTTTTASSSLTTTTTTSKSESEMRTNIATFCRIYDNIKNKNKNNGNVGASKRRQTSRFTIKNDYISSILIMIILLILSQWQLKIVSSYETTISTLSAAKSSSQTAEWPHKSSTMLNKIMPNHPHEIEYHKNRHLTTETNTYNSELVKNSIGIINYDEIISTSSSGSHILSRETFAPTVTQNKLGTHEKLVPKPNIAFDNSITNADINHNEDLLTEAVGDTTSSSSSSSSTSSISVEKQEQQHEQQQYETVYMGNSDFNQYKKNVISEQFDKMGTNSEMVSMPNHDHMRPWHTLFKQFNSQEIYDEIKGESDTDNNINLDNKNYHQSTGYYNLENINNNDVEDDSQLIADPPKKKPFISSDDNQKLLKLVIDGLGLQNLPDMRKANISQMEYASKYKEYVERVHQRQRRELLETRESLRSSHVDLQLESPLKFLTLTPNASMSAEYILKRGKRDVSIAGSYVDYPQRAAKNVRATSQNDKNNVLLHFPLNVDVSQLQPDDIEEANIRLMLVHSAALSHKQQNNSKRPCGVHKNKNTGGKQKHVINLKVYQLLEHEKRMWLDGRKIEIEVDRSKRDQTYSQWLQFDVTAAVEKWLRAPQENLGLEIQCSNCHRLGARILNDYSENANDSNNKDESADGGTVDLQLMPVLNIIGRQSGKNHEMHARKLRGSSAQLSAENHGHHHYNTLTQTEDAGKTDCHKENKRCCRHSMEVVFKEIKGYEFILQPKVFDAGYCRGRCPLHYHTANHHAVLQGLIWQQDPAKAPRPCCAPSKLVELEILHVDERDSEKLKISTWTDMRVVECACT